MIITKYTRCGKKDATCPDGYTNERLGGNTVANDIQIGRHARALEDIEETEWMIRVVSVCDPLTHKLATVLSDDGTFIRYASIELTPGEIAQYAADALQAKREQMEVTPFMFKQALNRSGGKRAEVDALVANPDTGFPEMDEDIKDGWASASTIRRLDPTALYVKWALQWSDEESDELFEVAETFRTRQ